MIHVDSWPRLGNSAFDVRIDNALAGSAAVLALSFGRLDTPMGGGCTLYLGNWDALFYAATSGEGRARFPLPVPNEHALRGFVLYAQGFVVDPQGAFGNVAAFTGALRLLLGD